MERRELTRQRDLIPEDKLTTPVTLIGAGAIGSWVAFCLVKMGMNVTVIDDDKITIENMNCQNYPMSAIGKHKAEALRDMIYDFTGTRIEAVVGRYTGGVFPGIVIVAVDNMATRKLVWEEHKKDPSRTKFIIDPRMGAEDALMYCMRPYMDEDIADYERTLYSDEEAVPLPCTAKATIYCANLLAGLVVKTVKDLITGGTYQRSVMWSIQHNEVVSGKGQA